MSTEAELRSLDALFESSFIQEVEYRSRRAQLLSALSSFGAQPGFAFESGFVEPASAPPTDFVLVETVQPKPVAPIPIAKQQKPQPQRVTLPPGTQLFLCN
jgi:hypothetical protein